MIAEPSQPIATKAQPLIDLSGTNEHPIPVLDEEEQKAALDKYIELSRREAIISAAALCNNSEDLALAITKTKFPGDLKAKETALENELKKYFQRRIGIDISCENF